MELKVSLSTILLQLKKNPTKYNIFINLHLYLIFVFFVYMYNNQQCAFLTSLTLILKLNITSIWAKNQELELITDNWQVLFEH